MADLIHSIITSGKPLQQNTAIQVCSKAGVNLLSKEKVKLEAMVDSLKYSVDILVESKSRHEFATNALLTLRIIKANCDAFISLASSATKAIAAVAPSPATKALAKGTSAVSDSYSTAGAWVGVKSAAEDGQIDVKGLNSLASKETKKIKGVKYLHANVNIVTDAMKQDYKALQKDLSNFVYEANKDASKLLVVSGRKAEYFSKNTARALGNTMSAVDATKSAVTAAFDYSNSLEKAFDQKISDDEFSQDLGRQIKSAQSKLQNIQSRLVEVNRALNECNASMGGTGHFGLA